MNKLKEVINKQRGMVNKQHEEIQRGQHTGVAAMLKSIHSKPRRDRLLIWRPEDPDRMKN